ncbi:hypothetical protein [Xanthobacter sp. KR7-225]|uniref:hypothetical protein n=1 Tax=Xanthobacter sp. KR7-225 TaxID=3156613 RepID=UPI0032B331E3
MWTPAIRRQHSRAGLRYEADLPYCIGAALDNSRNLSIEIVDKHRFLLEKLNNLSNACDHSFVNSDQTLAGMDEQALNVIALDRNSLAK